MLAWRQDDYGTLSAPKLLDILSEAIDTAIEDGVYMGLKDNWQPWHKRIQEISGEAVYAYNHRTTAEKKKAK